MGSWMFWGQQSDSISGLVEVVESVTVVYVVSWLLLKYFLLYALELSFQLFVEEVLCGVSMVPEL